MADTNPKRTMPEQAEAQPVLAQQRIHSRYNTGTSMTPTDNQNVSEPSQSRTLRPPSSGVGLGHGERWAVIVGISKYQYEPWNLKYADRDAEELYKLLQTPSAGAFPPEHIVCLVNEQATTRRISSALRKFLQQPKKDDLVLIYFACHGAPDPYRRSNVYLLTYDTDPEDIPGTALPMREITQSIRENLEAERLVILADTCHSAEIGGFGRSVDNNAVVNTYLKSLSEAREGVALLTSAEANETAWEDQKWGGGHGVFTHYLLEGMKGAADTQPKDGQVTVGELFEYVRDQVQKATNNQQNPSIGQGNFDRRLPMAITGGISAREHYDLGWGLYELGRRLDDPGRFASAGQHFQMAIDFSRAAGGTIPAAELGRGLALLAAGQLERAVEALRAAMKSGEDGVLSDAALNLGVALGQARHYTEALEAFEKFLALTPDDSNAAWVHELSKKLPQASDGEEYALLIGIAEYQDPAMSVEGAQYELPLIRDVFVNSYGFPESNITTLLNAQVTRQSILDAFARLVRQTTVHDTVVVYYSGWGGGTFQGGFLFVYDSVRENTTIHNSITAQDLHDLMTAIPASRKTVILDTGGSAEILGLAQRDFNYALLIGASPGQWAWVITFSDGLDRVRAGQFSYLLAQQLHQSKADLVRYGEIFGPVYVEMQRRQTESMQQTPVFAGDKERVIFTGTGDPLIALDAFRFGQRRNYSGLELDDLRRRSVAYSRWIPAPHPQLHMSFAKAFLEKEDYQQTIRSLQTAIEQGYQPDLELRLALAEAHYRLRQYDQALASLQDWPREDSAERAEDVRNLIAQIQTLQTGERYALLVGINQYANSDLRGPQGAVNDVQAIQQVLIDRYGFVEQNIVTRIDSQATRQAILDEFRQLAEKARQSPALFYFAGLGSAQDEESSLVSVDGRQGEVFDIRLSELAAAVGETPTNLVTIVDAGWYQHDLSGSGRVIEPDLRSRPSEHVLGLVIERSQPPARIGRVSISVGAVRIRTGSKAGPPSIEGQDQRTDGDLDQGIHGHLTYSLVQGLQQVDPETVTYRRWIQTADPDWKTSPAQSDIIVLGDDLDQRVFANEVAEGQVETLLADIQQQPIRQTIAALRRLIEQRNGIDPEAHLDLGVAYFALREYEKSIRKLEQAIDQRSNRDDVDYPEASYWLGRVLYESRGDLLRATSELRQVTEREPENMRAQYYLGQSLRALAEQQILAEAEQALQRYLSAGTPIGQEDEVRAFLNSRREAAQTATR